ncbi:MULTISPECIES: HAMP domain-containing sensor histidine kinase [unclassified Parafrankia]|uniref:sensor histidine kinase n=1 Tax=unclassified Parafrankia TaxID=2994368 RepID=UPI000DA570A4|nr:MULTISPECIES: HAMP domain-containing sensor histidine kinase [unclassified Parafrankia]TCJ35081.1 HAMP domain-containing histidine kinase [Parafrankia sp. BMG5.11]CAI7973738.1 Sensor protein CutS [Frankia sp. Hr75.2]SQE00098.1 Sensor protein CutS [Parafrankia sp. Ea1.12]
MSVRIRLALMCGGLFLLSGVVLLAVNYLLVRSALPPAAAPAAHVFEGTVTMPGQSGPGLPGTVGTGSGPETGVLTVVRAVRNYRGGVLNTLLVQSGVAIGATLILALLLGWVVADRTLRPVQAVVATARRLGADNLDARIRLRGPRDELTELADTFDEMLDRLAASFDSQRRFVANASHELRTPLAAQRTLVEVAMGRPGAEPALRELGTRLLTMNVRIEALIEGLLVLARSDRGLAVRQVVCLDEVVETVVDTHRAVAAEAGVDLRWERTGHDRSARPPDLVWGDRVLLERMVSNLVDNAIKYNRRGGTVWVRDGRDPVLWVANTGPPVPSSSAVDLFEPFSQAGRGSRGAEPGAQPGAGLGLSIVASIVRAHGGSVRAVSRPEGGLEMAVFLPTRESA